MERRFYLRRDNFYLIYGKRKSNNVIYLFTNLPFVKFVFKFYSGMLE